MGGVRVPPVDLVPLFCPADVDPDQTRDWYFTFGHGQRLVAASTGDVAADALGLPLDGMYVVIRAPFVRARNMMMTIFGTVWSQQYSSATRAGVVEFSLIELRLPVALLGRANTQLDMIAADAAREQRMAEARDDASRT